MGNPQPWPLFKVEDVDGNPVSGAKIYTYIPGTTNDQNTYLNADRASNHANANPVITDSRGEALIYLTGATKFYITDADGVEIKRIEWISDNGSTGIYDAGYYGTVGSYATLTAALTAIGSTNPAILFLPYASGGWIVSSDTTITSNITIQREPGAFFNVANTKTLTIKGPIEAGPFKLFSWNSSGTIDISTSPTPRYCLEWFGGQALKTFDNSTAWIKSAASVGEDQILQLYYGEYGLLTAMVLQGLTQLYYGYHIEGMGPDASRIYIALPGGTGVGLTIGTGAGYPGMTFNMSFKNFSVVGPQNPCDDGILLINGNDVAFDNVNLYLSCNPGYQLHVKGCIWVTGNIRTGRTYSNWGDYYWSSAGTHPSDAPNGIKFENTSLSQINVLNIKINVEQSWFTDGIVVDGSLNGGGGHRITGSIENCVNPLTMTGYDGINIADMYIDDGNLNGPTFIDCSNISLNDTSSSNANDPVTTLTNCGNTRVEECKLSTLLIDANCRGTTIGSLNGSIIDNAPDTIVVGAIRNPSNYPQVTQSGAISVPRNLMANAYLDTWTSGTYPDGWGDGSCTLTKCGAAESDTTNNLVDYCMKVFNDTAGSAYIPYNLSATILKLVKGRVINFSMAGKLKSTQTFTQYPTLLVTYAVPVRVNSTTYQVGEAVTIAADLNGMDWLCIVGGQSDGSSPTMPTDPYYLGTKITDGAVTWKAVAYNGGQFFGSFNFFGAGDIGGKFKRLTTGGYIPSNCTAVSLNIYQTAATSGGNSTAYWAEPCLFIGWHGPNTFVPGIGEN